jgi:hypothetical protein
MLRAALVGFVLSASTMSTAALAAPDKSGIVDPFAKGSHPESANRKRAAQLSAQSAQSYKRGEFEVAAVLLRQAYALYPEPNLLYNLARALEGMGDKAGAVDAYEKYLATAKRIEDRGAIERRVATLKGELASSAQPRTQPGAPPRTQPRGDEARIGAAKTTQPQGDEPPRGEPMSAQAAPAAVEPAAPPPRDDIEAAAQPTQRITPPSKLPWIPIVGGIAVIGVGVGFGMSAKNFAELANNEPSALDAETLHVSAQNNATIANVMFVVGGAAIVTGVVWEVIVLRRQSKKTDLPNLRPVASARSVALEWAW